MHPLRRLVFAWSPAALLASCWIAAITPTRAEGEATESWQIDFNDPLEAERWKRYPGSRDSGLVAWRIAPRNASEPEGERVLEVSATSGLGVVSAMAIYRPFPEGFRPGADHALVFDWEWKIADTELSDSVGISLLWGPPEEEPEGRWSVGVLSHTRYTMAWRVLFDPANTWVRHRIGRSAPLIPSSGRRPWGILLKLVDPVRQRVWLSRLRIESWPAGAIETDPIFGPHRAPRPGQPFREAPLSTLTRAVAGALEDLDGDGLPELLVLQHRDYAHLYRNDGSGEFTEELTRKAGLDFPAIGTGALFVDLDGDLDRDLAVSAEYESPLVFTNEGGLAFRGSAPLGDSHLGFWYVAAADDYDRDGDVDLAFVGPIGGETLALIENDDGALVPSPRSVLEVLPTPYGHYSVSFADLDADGYPEMLVAPEHLFRNERGAFRLHESWVGAGPEVVEGGVFADLTGDGILDLLLVRDGSQASAATRLLRGDARGGFEDRTADAGFPRFVSAEVALTEDFDNDGDLDLYVCQHRRENYLLLNDGSGRFSDATEGSGLDDSGVCEAAVAADVDGDGGVDVVVFGFGSAARILRNRLERGNWLGLDVQGMPPASDAIGARVEVRDGRSGAIVATRWVRRGRGFGSNGPAELRVGLGARLDADVRVRFPSGAIWERRVVAANRTVLAREPGASTLDAAASRLAAVRFPIRRHVRLALGRQPALALPIVAGAFTAGVLFSLWRRVRVGFALILLAGALAAWLAGSVPGRGIAGMPSALWLFGAASGAALPPLAIVGRDFARRVSRPREQAIAPEELIRFTHDFRHAGVESRTLIAIHGRLQNLFFDGRLHAPFLESLRDLVQSHVRSSSPRLCQLLEMIEAGCPGLEITARVGALETRLREKLEALEQVASEVEALRRWREELLPVLGSLREGIPELLRAVDRRFSCDVSAVVREACALHAERLRQRGVEIGIDDPSRAAPALAAITAIDLLTIVENLLSNALAALEGRHAARIDVSVRALPRAIELLVRDNGPGVLVVHAERIFQYGFTTREGSRGYGLPRSRELLSHYAGRIELADSGEEAGAAFLVTLRTVP